MPRTVVDLFCGVGGMTHGFRKEGFSVEAGFDLDESARYAYETNNDAEFVAADLTATNPADVEACFPAGNTRILVGCAPCQPFSLYTNRKSPDQQWRLLSTFADIVEHVEPEVVSMENVPRVTRHPVFRQFVERLKRLEYFVSYSFARGPDYGVPQRRTRLVLFASRLGTIDLIEPTHTKGRVRTVRQTIEHLEPLEAGGASKKDPLHRTRGLSETNLRRIRATPAGGAWNDWDEDLILACHKKKTGKTFRSVYGRMKWDEPSPVITTQCLGLGNGRFGHPEQDRAISLREAALLQSFPKSYDFIDPKQRFSGLALARHIGNAVPVRLGRVVARSIARHLDEEIGA